MVPSILDDFQISPIHCVPSLLLRCLCSICMQPVYDTKKVIAILTYNQMPETDELRYEVQMCCVGTFLEYVDDACFVASLLVLWHCAGEYDLSQLLLFYLNYG